MCPLVREEERINVRREVNVHRGSGGGGTSGCNRMMKWTVNIAGSFNPMAVVLRGFKNTPLIAILICESREKEVDKKKKKGIYRQIIWVLTFFGKESIPILIMFVVQYIWCKNPNY